MKSATLEPRRSAPKAPAVPRPVTPFANRLEWPVAGVPQRYRAQEAADDDDRASAARILAEYRRQQEVFRINDISAHAEAIQRHENAAQHVEAEQMRRAMGKCDHDQFVSASESLQELVDAATAVVLPVMDRLLDSLTDELDQLVSRREQELTKFEIALFTDTEDWRGVIRNGLRQHTIRTWELHSHREIRVLHSMREVTRNLRSKYDNPGAWTITDIKRSYSIPFLTFACTNEDIRFEWGL